MRGGGRGKRTSTPMQLYCSARPWPCPQAAYVRVVQEICLLSPSRELPRTERREGAPVNKLFHCSRPRWNLFIMIARISLRSFSHFSQRLCQEDRAVSIRVIWTIQSSMFHINLHLLPLLASPLSFFIRMENVLPFTYSHTYKLKYPVCEPAHDF